MQTQHGPTLHVQYYAFNDTLMLELQAAGYASDGSSVVRPKVQRSTGSRSTSGYS